MRKDPTKRFSDRVENYVKYRPSYPINLIDHLRKNNILTTGQNIADIGSGTGIFSRLLLTTENNIFAVEPNKEMRIAAEKSLQNKPNFNSINGSAENTTLKENSIDIITAAQSFHWFDLEKTKKEFLRILKPNGYIVLVWNVRKSEGSPFSTEYEKLLKSHIPEYSQVSHRNIDLTRLGNFTGPNDLQEFSCQNIQVFDFEGIKGRLQSSSYTPTEERAEYSILIKDLKEIFNRFQVDGVVQLLYTCEMYFGQLNK
ncbi:class I SAM-dependent methyltransferase [Promethearchaeum syntrophicum]|uniref:Class I SAM-dependent methyltransferase n=1 Tax=Promethearchaeum syntrophicum TaxID=2594042 RepID=A0A5B9DF24_9ARCH|nr:class I SAM-dependent methyltransferase [Candidatus Prometheoarchaeum syntrophicum]QEE17621.1 ubiquinone/menaquinone biosynthesis methyltransferase [Candidatus Prometheoarchaeum syntrophicum]